MYFAVDMLIVEPSMRELRHLIMFSGTEPVFGRKGFDPGAILAKPYSYFEQNYDLEYIGKQSTAPLYWNA